MGWYKNQKARHEAHKAALAAGEPVGFFDRLGEAEAKRLTKNGKKPIVVTTVSSNGAAERLIAAMLRRGYKLDKQSSRKAVYSATAGIFTSKQKHTLTFLRRSPSCATPA